MQSLREHDVSALLDFLQTLYALRDLRRFRCHLISAVPKLVQAYENARAVTTMAEDPAAAMNAMKHFGRAAIVLTRDGRVRLSSTVAEQLFSKYFGSRRSGGLPDHIKNWLEHQHSLLGGMKPPVPLIVDRGQESLTVRMLPDCDQVLLHLSEQVTAIRPQGLQAQGLTMRAVEVRTWMARGKTNAEVA